jgi:acyl-CoA thioester hydrolase
MSIDTKADFSFYYPITTRWMDNDLFGHINNVIYYSFFDTVVNQFLIEEANYNPHESHVIGLMVESSCQYKQALSYPDKLTGAFRVNRLGNSSVEYAVGIFKENEKTASAIGVLTHVFVTRETTLPIRIPTALRNGMQLAMIES